jgi:hypothetical protein
MRNPLQRFRRATGTADPGVIPSPDRYAPGSWAQDNREQELADLHQHELIQPDDTTEMHARRGHLRRAIRFAQQALQERCAIAADRAQLDDANGRLVKERDALRLAVRDLGARLDQARRGPLDAERIPGMPKGVTRPPLVTTRQVPPPPARVVDDDLIVPWRQT